MRNYKLNISWIFNIIIFLSLVTTISCSSEGQLDKVIAKSVRDGIVNQEEWEKILSLAENNKKFQEDGVLSESLLQEYIKEYAQNKMRGIEEVSFDNLAVMSMTYSGGQIKNDDPIKIKFYLERSGSMTSYDSPSCKGDFKKAISTLLNSLPEQPSEDELMYIVNDAVYLYNKSYKDFLISKDIFADTKNFGDPRYTDFSCIFDSLLTHTASDELSIFVSDLIYSTKEMESTNPQKILNEAQSLTTSVFRGHDAMDVTIIKLNSDFQGKYYPYNSPSKGINYSGNRPFYIMLVGSPSIMNRILTEKKYANFSNFKNLQGFENYYCFTNAGVKPPYSILLTDPRVRGRIKPLRDGAKQIHNIADMEKDREGYRTIAIAVDLSNVLSSDEFKKDKKNYDIESLSDFYLEDVFEVETSDMTPELKRSLPDATHILLLSTDADKLRKETLKIHLKNKIPEWIEETNANIDTNIGEDDFSNKTFAFGYLMHGIYDSFFNSVDKPVYFTLPIEINK